MINVYNTLTSIPWFVWLLFYYTILNGVKALQTHVLSIKKIFIVPLIFLGLGITGLVKQGLPFINVAIWLGLVAIATAITWRGMVRTKVACDKQKGLIQLPGTWTTLILLLSIFVSKFTFGFLNATHPELKGFYFFNLADLAISGTVCGISCGRLTSLLAKFFKSAHCYLEEPN